MPPSNGNTQKALRPWRIMLMALAANFQDAGTDDIPAYVFKMHACVLQFSSIMSMIQKRKRARIYWVGRATGRMCEARTPRDWDAYLQEAHMTDNRFRRMFRMSKAHFETLVKKLDDYWVAEATPGRHGSVIGRPKKICTEIQLALTLRWLAGGSYLDITEIYSVHDSTFYNIIARVVPAINKVLPEWRLVTALKNPQAHHDLDRLAAGFSRRTGGLLKKVIGAIDGILIPIAAPTGEDPTNARTYFCRKGFYCINVQGICNAEYEVIYASIGLCPGSTHDSFAWRTDEMYAFINGEGIDDHGASKKTNAMLRLGGYHLIGDDAYMACHVLATPWPGRFDDKKDGESAKLCYNYWHSCARMSIEQTFGQLSRKWLILKRPYAGSLVRTSCSPGIFTSSQLV